MLADVDSYFYDSYKDDLRLTELQSQFIDYAKPIPGGTALTEEILKSIVGDLKVFSQNQIDDLNFKKILELVNSPVDPYAPKKKGLI